MVHTSKEWELEFWTLLVLTSSSWEGKESSFVNYKEAASDDNLCEESSPSDLESNKEWYVMKKQQIKCFRKRRPFSITLFLGSLTITI